MEFFKNKREDPPEEKLTLDEYAEIAESGKWEVPSFEDFDNDEEEEKMKSVMDFFRPNTPEGMKKAKLFIGVALAATALASAVDTLDFDAGDLRVENTGLDEDGIDNDEEGEEPPPKFRAKTLAYLESMEVQRNEQMDAGEIVISDEVYEAEQKYLLATDANDDIGTDTYEDVALDEMYTLAKNSGNVQDLLLTRFRLEDKNEYDALDAEQRNAEGKDFVGENRERLDVLDAADSEMAEERNKRIQELTTIIQEKINMPIPDGKLSDAQRAEVSENFRELKVLYSYPDELENNGDAIYDKMYGDAMAGGRIANLLDMQEMMSVRESKEHDSLDMSRSDKSAELNALERRVLDTITMLPAGKALEEVKRLFYEKDYVAVAKLCNKNGIA
ncbi:hypothetical protein HOB10_05630 [Candidatus Parcubacteria bacterium]|jgi:hypothetical protein|nr:hypothetical protein [Candidatus Parcubacteria bacterium]